MVGVSPYGRDCDMYLFVIAATSDYFSSKSRQVCVFWSLCALNGINCLVWASMDNGCSKLVFVGRKAVDEEVHGCVRRRVVCRQSNGFARPCVEER